jgi:DNA-directed RNA polymerase subunit RPC12/RpoP
MFDRFLRSPGRRGGGHGDIRQGGRGGRGGETNPDSGPGGECVCPSCGHKVVHQAGHRCLDIECPRCSTRMVRT